MKEICSQFCRGCARKAEVVLVVCVVTSPFAQDVPAAEGESSELSDVPIPLMSEEDLPPRTPPLIEIGPDFLGTGNLPKGIELPTGAVWTPALWIFGDYRTALNYYDNGDTPRSEEWVNRLDLFANLQLSGTERLLFGMEPLNDGNEFTGYIWKPDRNDGFESGGFNADITTLFFEGEFGEIFPNLDPDDTGSFDYGFAVGRQPIFIQEGMMFNDTIDSVGITRDTVFISNSSVDSRITGLFGWNNLSRNDNNQVNSAYVVGLFTETDFRPTTTNLDVAYVFANERHGGDGLFVGASATQRIGKWNTSFRGNVSVAMDGNSKEVSTGGLLFAETSRTLAYGDNVIYGNAFWGIDDFASAARDRLTGGPLGRVGLLFEAVGLGAYGSALSNQAQDVVGGSVGHQWFFNSHRTQLVLEVGGRLGTDSKIDNAGAIGGRFQQAVGRRTIIRFDAFTTAQENHDEGYGARAELLYRF
jgi:hypothetical protein